MQNLRQKVYSMLRKSERFFKTDMVYLTKGGFWLLSGQIVNASVGLALAIGFANLLPPNIYGNYKFVLSVAAIIGALSLTGLGTAITRAVAQGYEGSLKEGFRINFKWSLLGSAVAFIASGYYFINDNIFLSLSLLIIGSTQPLLQSSRLFPAFMGGKKDFRNSTLFNSARFVGTALVLLTLLFVTDNPIILVLGYFTTYTLLSGIGYFVTLKLYTPGTQTTKETVRYGKHLSLIGIIAIVTQNLDKILVFHYLGAVELAIYAFALIIPQQVSSLFRNVAVLAMPKLSTMHPEIMRASVYQKSRLLMVPLILTALAYIFTAPFIYRFLFPQYEASILISQFAILSLIALVSLLPGIALQAGKAIKAQHKIVIYGGTLQIIILFPLVILYGVWGALGAHVLAKTIKVFLTYNAFHKFTEPKKI